MDYFGISSDRWRDHVIIDLTVHKLNTSWLRERLGDQDVLMEYDQREWVTCRNSGRGDWLLIRNRDVALEYILRW